jgi:hypothetical protein
MATIISFGTDKETLLVTSSEYDAVKAYANRQSRNVNDIGLLEALCAISGVDYPTLKEPDPEVYYNTKH